MLKPSILPLGAVLTLLASPAQAQQLGPLTVEKIMRDPAQWLGSSPNNIAWAEDGKTIYFTWNPEKARRDSLYRLAPSGGTARKVSLREQQSLPTQAGEYDQGYTRKVYEKDGDIYLLDLKTQRVRRVTNTAERETDAQFALQGRTISYTRAGNLFTWDPATGETTQRTDFRRGNKPASGEPTDKSEKFLRAQQLALFEVLRGKEQDAKARQRQQKALAKLRPKAIWLGQQTVQNLRLSPDGRYVTYTLVQEPAAQKVALVPNFVTTSGFTEDISTRTKVGAAQTAYQLGLYDVGRDTTFVLGYKELKGLDEQPAYRKEYQLQAKAPTPSDTAKAAGTKKEKPATEVRRVIPFGPFWSDNGQHAFLVIRSTDNKDRWIVALDPATQKIRLLDRQHDDAWINGPGIGYDEGNVGWLPDNRRIWFQSEETGFSHLYTADFTSGQKKALTSGRWEVQKAQLSRDRKTWYLTANKTHPGEQHFYRLPLEGGSMTQITTQPGASEVTLSPDEKTLAVRYSTSNKPWELFVMDNKPGAKLRQLTHSTTPEFESYPWRAPEVISYKARDGADVYARLYRPANAAAQGPAVIFVHGAGYLQNAHKWWSTYFREYMFHNLLADKGYTVLDIDYRGSAGYGRDVRTGIYRYMGGKDLTDQVDGVKLLTEKYGVSPQRIGIYGGSYGGFITLMAMFTQPEVFQAGAALRSVTDWAHYNHGYTDNILNEPYNDSLAYARSSPINYAAGLKGHLLMCHGMVDTNVHFQDIVRLSQRLIELKKDNWELAVYPVEDHGFVEPSSWTDEYKRILKLFETTLNPAAPAAGTTGGQ
ncbi:dipeptidyl aminopeptidase/acylaminoacyl peptidase [Hymenobacter luteus]|uniref:Dipeptidyl aminopeptidase/acylaminoacyl peptidase n=2 Tax=Hymenobacter TaxID=89966 RepID=A0A7W9SZG4_9BACT|nr:MULTISPECIES: prolyl oligopeptidase family serine peptidase [Hymenobacter]MBB4599906.1 dipeptidyl aminopeptidase/acylaminoacyl peptidase [Hymenobacter latericoloratus]MBB6057784.1 dipeptidyl aminopeptidase/acylaminoacyl peptidase [Hymenobacter luteus]